MIGSRPKWKEFPGLPTELLISIIAMATLFTAHDDCPQSDFRFERPWFFPFTLFFPFTALFVCRQWHDIAMSLPHLWSDVHACDQCGMNWIKKKISHQMDLSRGYPMALHLHIQDELRWGYGEVLSELRTAMRFPSRWGRIRVVCTRNAAGAL